jgi:ATP-dependent Clp protease ATP-binding subunit ClpA
MYQNFTDQARKVMQLANQEAQRFNHEYIGTEHILLALVKEGEGVAANVLKNLGVSLRKIRIEVEKLVQSGPDPVTMGKLPKTPRAKMVLAFSKEEAERFRQDHVGTEHILLGLLREGDNVAGQVLTNLGLELEEVRQEVLGVLGHDTEEAEHPEPPERAPRMTESLPIDTEPITPTGRESGDSGGLAKQVLLELLYGVPIATIVGLLARSWLVFGVAWALVGLQGVVRCLVAHFGESS